MRGILRPRHSHRNQVAGAGAVESPVERGAIRAQEKGPASEVEAGPFCLACLSVAPTLDGNLYGKTPSTCPVVSENSL